MLHINSCWLQSVWSILIALLLQDSPKVALLLKEPFGTAAGAMCFFFGRGCCYNEGEKWCFQRWWGAICVTVSWEVFKSLLLYPFFIRTWFQPFSVRDNFHHERFMPWSYRFFTHEISTIWSTDIADSWLECGFLWMFVGGCPDQPTWNTNYTPENLHGTWKLALGTWKYRVGKG